MRIKGVLSFVAFAAIVVSAFGFFSSMGVTFSAPPQRIHLSMEIPDINGLVVGSSVQLRGVPIGEVTDTATSLAGATIKFDVDDRYAIPEDTDVRLENLSALGEAYIGLVPRSAGGPTFHDGQRIAAEAITAPPSISELATSVVRILNQLDPAALQRIVGEADAAFPSPTEVLPNLARASTLLRNTAATMNGSGSDLLTNLQALLRNADFVGPVLAYNAPWIRKIGRDTAALNLDTVTLYQRGAPQTLHNLSHLVGRIEHFLDHSGGDVKVLMQTMLPYLNDTSGALMNLDTGQILANMLAAVPEDGAVTLHVTIPDGPTLAGPAASGAPGPATDGAAIPNGPDLTLPAAVAPPAPGDGTTMDRTPEMPPPDAAGPPSGGAAHEH